MIVPTVCTGSQRGFGTILPCPLIRLDVKCSIYPPKLELQHFVHRNMMSGPKQHGQVLKLQNLGSF